MRQEKEKEKKNKKQKNKGCKTDATGIGFPVVK